MSFNMGKYHAMLNCLSKISFPKKGRATGEAKFLIRFSKQGLKSQINERITETGKV